ncbi:MAG: hypothetical protein GKS00_02005 [Alphaproteobacteria bacterium]|nr:hypothetical protein [Alphaproteobacteria bacterium]
MAQIRQYQVTFHPAHRDDGFIVISFEMTKSYPKHTFEAAGVADMVARVGSLAAGHGAPCSASVRCLSPRKPPGFDRATANLYFNLDAPGESPA